MSLKGQQGLAEDQRSGEESNASSGPRLPPEIQRLCLARLDLRLMRSGWVNDEALLWRRLKDFASLRLVDRATKEAVETFHPECRRRFQMSIVVSYLANPTATRTLELARMSEVLSITEIKLDWYPPQLLEPFDAKQCDGFNSLLSICTSLHTLDWDFVYQEMDLSLLKLELAPSLRHLIVRALPNDTDLALLKFHRLANLESLTVDAGEQMYSYLPPAHLPTRLKMLSLPTMFLEAEHLEAAQGMLAELESLEDLDMSGNPLGREGIRFLNLPRFKSLSRVDLSHTQLGDAGVAALQLHLTSVQELGLQNNDITDPTLLRLQGNTSLKLLDLAGNALATYDFALDSNTTLQKLHLNACKGAARTPRHFTSLARQLETNKALVELDLSHCDLHDEQIIGFTLANATGVEKFILHGNTLSEEAIRRLGVHVNLHLKKVTFGPRSYSGNVMELSQALLRDLTSNGCVVDLYDDRARRVSSTTRT